MNPIIENDCRAIWTRISLESLRGKKILLTGANGFLGQFLFFLIHIANKENIECSLYCVSLHEPNKAISRLLPNNNIQWKSCDLTAVREIWPEVKFDYIIHAACYGQPAKFVADPLRTIDLNVNVTRKLLELAVATNARFVFFSSADVYGEMPQGTSMVSEDYNGNCSTLSIRAIYRESKRMGETICSVFARDYGVGVVILRILSLYGPGVSIDDTRVVGNFIKGALLEKRINLLDQGSSKRAYGYIADVMTMIMYAMINGRELVYNVGGIDVLTVRELAEFIATYCGVPYEVPAIKSKLKHIGIDPSFLRVDLSRILDEMGGFIFTPFEVGMRRTIEWNKQELEI